MSGPASGPSRPSASAGPYLKGGLISGFLPAGKTWLKWPGGPAAGFTGSLGQPINITEPGTLRTLISRATKVKGVCRGTITFGELWKTSKWFRDVRVNTKPKAAEAKTEIDHRLYVDGRGQITRLVSSYDDADLESRVTTDTVFSGWGRRVSIKPPARGTVANLTELDVDTGELPTPVTIGQPAARLELLDRRVGEEQRLLACAAEVDRGPGLLGHPVHADHRADAELLVRDPVARRQGGERAGARPGRPGRTG
ncbi:MAG: hypothetical protein IRY84_09920, partial [Thermobispora bispora]|nr:hypothetical protein [Thermobispora bispora]